MYFPTAGRDDQFISTLASLNILLKDIFEKHDAECPLFIRGDANASFKNVVRSQMLKHFLAQHNLLRLNITHKTYHHFVGNGAFDSDLDVVLFTNMLHCSESLTNVICRLVNPLIESLHDIIVSSFTVPPAPPALPPSQDNVTAPRIPNTRQKVIWSDEGIVAYKSAVAGQLDRLKDT